MIILLYWLGALVALILAFIWGAEIKHAQYASDIEELTAQRDAAQEVLAFVKEENLKIRQLLGTPEEAETRLYGAPTGIDYTTHTEGEESWAEEGMPRFGAGILGLPGVAEANQRATDELKRLLHLGPLE